MKQLEVAIIGGGLSGMTAAAHLSSAGVNTIVLETKDILGGRGISWDQQRNAEARIQPLLGLYNETPQLLTMLGVNPRDVLLPYEELHIRLPGKILQLSLTREADEEGGSTVKIVKNEGVLDKDSGDTWIKFTQDGTSALIDHPDEVDALSIQDYARQNKLPEQLIDHLVQPLSEGLFLTSPSEYSALAFFKSIEQVSLNKQRIRLASFRGTMTEELIDPLRLYIESRGGEVLTDVNVDGILWDKEQNMWKIANQWEDIYTPNLIIATPIHVAQLLLKPLAKNEKWVKDVMELQSHPTVTMQLRLERSILSNRELVLTPKSNIATMHQYQDQATSQCYLNILMSHPHEHSAADNDELLSMIKADLGKLGYKVPPVLECRKFVSAEDLYWHAPGSERKRPPQKTPLHGLYLAGDYTKLPHSDIIESAIASGRLAAHALLDDIR